MEEYAASRDWDRVDRLKRDILSLYREDIIKHASGYEMKVESIFDEIPDQLQRRESHFKFSSIRKEARYREYKDALYWLDDAMIVNICYNSTVPNKAFCLTQLLHLRTSCRSAYVMLYIHQQQRLLRILP